MRSKGFTLVEILVVVVIMAVVISLAVLSIGVTGRDSAARSRKAAASRP
jgi:prepilin-type N-terminal cleavage/methylation domain-containing protein